MERTNAPHEEATINAFIVKERRDRFLELLPHPKHRRKVTSSLAHANLAWFDQRYVRRIRPNESNPGAIAALLRAQGAGRTCWLISENPKLDGREAELDSALAQTIGYGMGTVISFIPGKLAFVETEDHRFILAR